MISGVPCRLVQRSGTLRDVVPTVEIDRGESPHQRDLVSTANDVDKDDPQSPPRPESRSPFANGPPGGVFPPFAPHVQPDKPVGRPPLADRLGRPPPFANVSDEDERNSVSVRLWRDQACHGSGCEQCRKIPKWLKVVFRSPRKSRRVATGTYVTYQPSLRKSSILSSVLATHGSGSSRLSAQLSTAIGSEMGSGGASGNKGTWRTRVKFTLRNLLTKNKKKKKNRT